MLLPMASVEFQRLWLTPEFRFFPIPIAVVAIWTLVQKREIRTQVSTRLIFARILYLFAAVALGVGVWKSVPWLAHFSLVLLFTSWALEQLSALPWPKVIGWSLLLATSLRFPTGVYEAVDHWILRQSTWGVSKILDGLSIPFLVQADTFSMRGLTFQISECCAGVFSWSALLSAAVLILLLHRRSLLTALCTLMTLPLWYIVQQMILMLVVVLLKHQNGRDASQGVDHMLLQLGIFVVILFCVWSSAWFFGRLFQAVPAADGEFEPEFLLLNAMLCWPQPDPFANHPVAAKPTDVVESGRAKWGSSIAKQLSWAGAACLIALGGIATQRWVHGGLALNRALPRVDAKLLNETPWKSYFEADVPGRRLLSQRHELTREEKVERALVRWQFDWKEGQVIDLSLSFPHEDQQSAAATFENLGWRILSEQKRAFSPTARTAQDGNSNNSNDDAKAAVREPWLELKMSNELGGFAHALVTTLPLQDESSGQTHPFVARCLLLCESGEELSAQQLSELYAEFYRMTTQLRETALNATRKTLAVAP